MSDQPKVTPDPSCEMPGRQQGKKSFKFQLIRIMITLGRNIALWTGMITVVYVMDAIGYSVLGGLLFILFLFWRVAALGGQPAPDVWRLPRPDSGDSYALGAGTGVVVGPESAAGTGLYRLRDNWDE